MIEAAWLLFSISVGLVYLVCSKRVVKVSMCIYFELQSSSVISVLLPLYTLFSSRA